MRGDAILVAPEDFLHAVPADVPDGEDDGGEQLVLRDGHTLLRARVPVELLLVGVLARLVVHQHVGQHAVQQVEELRVV